jgi:signal transduction histidine kinase
LRKLAELETRDVERAPVQIPELLEEVVELAGATTNGTGRGITLEVQRVPWTPAPVVGDRDLLLLAIDNVVDNALKFSDAAATVEIRAREDGNATLVEVGDTGPGIAADDLPHVTEELYRGEHAQRAEGSGLGLALAERVAALHSGELLIRSRPGLGTLVALRLPHGRG